MRPNVRAAVAAALVGSLLAGVGCAPKPATEDTSSSQNPPATTAGTVAGPAGPLHVDDGGAGGTPVLFVNAFSGNSTHWANALAHLRTTRRAIAFDLRGHGESAAPADSAGWAVDSLAADIGEVADQLALDRFVLVGHSLGGAASAAYAGAHPDRVAGLVLVGTPGPSPPAAARQISSRLAAAYDTTMAEFWTRLLAHATPETEARIRGESTSLSRDASLALVRAVFTYDPMPALRAYPGPVLVVDTDAAQGPSSIHALAPRLPHKVIAGTSHWPQLDKPAEFAAILDEFLATVGASGGAPTDTL